MDPVMLATSIAALVTPYLAKMGETMAREIGAKAPDVIGKLWQVISDRFKDNPAASEVANDLAHAPNDTDNREAFIIQLKKALKADDDFARQLADLLQDAQGGTVVKASDHGTAIGKIEIGGSFSGNIIMGDNNAVNQDKNRPS